MDRAQKSETVATLKKTFNETNVVVVTRNLGLTVAQSTDLRNRMRNAGAAYRVTKNTLTNDRLEIVGGAMGETVLDAKGVKALAALPSLDELRATIVGLIQAPASKIARTVNEPAAQQARINGAYAAKEAA
jgi:large subunit ribosomal protein L10